MIVLSDECKAFIKAYRTNVGSAPNKIVEHYLVLDDEDFEKFHGHEYYSSLADAVGIWNDAITFANKNK